MATVSPRARMIRRALHVASLLVDAETAGSGNAALCSMREALEVVGTLHETLRERVRDAETNIRALQPKSERREDGHRDC